MPHLQNQASVTNTQGRCAQIETKISVVEQTESILNKKTEEEAHNIVLS